MKKVKISFEEYQKIAMVALKVMKDFEAEGQENVEQKNIVDKMVQILEVHNSARSVNLATI